MYTLSDLEAAKTKRDTIKSRMDNYDGNNPNKFRAELESAQTTVAQIERNLKSCGVIPLTDHELLEKELDILFPNAKSKEVVEYKGQKYQRRFLPISYSLSGKVLNWDKSWDNLQEK